MNNVILCGRIARAVELQKTTSGMSIIKNAIACDRGGRDKGTDFVPVTFFGNTAELVGKFVRKGDRIGIEGHVRVETRENQDGKRTFFDVVADRVEFLGGGQRQEVQYSTPENYHNAPVTATQLPQQLKQEMDEDQVDPNDLPF